jgi:hypothetical protein
MEEYSNIETEVEESPSIIESESLFDGYNTYRFSSTRTKLLVCSMLSKTRLVVTVLENKLVSDKVAGVDVVFPARVILISFGLDPDAFWRDFIIGIGLLTFLLMLLLLLLSYKR